MSEMIAKQIIFVFHTTYIPLLDVYEATYVVFLPIPTIFTCQELGTT